MGLSKSKNMPWWAGMKILDPNDKSEVQIDCLLDFLNSYCKPPGRNETLDIPGEIKAGYSPIGFVRCGRSACRATKFNFKVGKETGGKKMDNPHSLKSNEMAEVVFVPQQPLVVDSF